MSKPKKPVKKKTSKKSKKTFNARKVKAIVKPDSCSKRVVDKYQATQEPQCHNGNGCKPCWDKYQSINGGTVRTPKAIWNDPELKDCSAGGEHEWERECFEMSPVCLGCGKSVEEVRKDNERKSNRRYDTEYGWADEWDPFKEYDRYE